MEIAPKIPQFADFADELITWMQSAAEANSEGKTDRPWCTLKLPGIDEEAFTAYFNRAMLGQKYIEAYHQASSSSKPYAFLQMESDLIYAMHKCFAARHRGRLMTYRDACSQQKYHTLSAIGLGLSKYTHSKDLAEQIIENDGSLTA